MPTDRNGDELQAYLRLYRLMQDIRICECLDTLSGRTLPRQRTGPMTHTDHDHDQGHDHGHGSSLRSRFSHAVSDLVGGHSHDAADQVDEALEADAAGRRALLISLAGLAVTAAIQAVVVVVSGSVALLGDTLHNVADALTAVPLLIAFRLARRPPTK